MLSFRPITFGGLLLLSGCGARASLPLLSGSASRAPRLIAPLSTSTVTSHSPTLRWALAGGGTTTIDICRDRACTQVEQSLAASGDHTKPAPLTPGVHFWRARSSGETSATWEFFVGARSAATDTSWGSTLDVNGDGYADVAVDAVSENGQTGAVHVYRGGPSGLSTTASATLNGPGKPYVYAFVANAGDLNGDGFADLAVGVIGLPNAGTVGRVYVYFGSAAGVSAHRALLLSAQDPDTRFGGAVAGVGDVNGDGYGDLLVGAPDADGKQGRAYLYFGGPHGPANPVSIVPPKGLTDSPAQFGSAVSDAGDVDGDGLDDFIIGAPDQGAWGEAYLYRGNPSESAPPIATKLTTATTGEDPLVTDSSFGSVVRCAGDVNGDGYADVLVTAGWTNDRRSGNVDVASNDGRVYVYLGGPSGLPVAPASEIEGPDTYAFGNQAAGAGDVDGDGYSDLLLGAFGDGHTASVMGNAFVYRGGPGGVAPKPAVQLDGPDGTGGFFGEVSTSPGDVNGDGFADVVVAAYEAADTAGRVYVFPGSKSGIPTAPSVTLTGPQGSNFGSAVALRGRPHPCTGGGSQG